MSIIYIATIFSIIQFTIIVNLLKCSVKSYYRVIDNLRFIGTFSLVFGYFNFFILFAFECYHELQGFTSLYQAKIYKTSLIINGLKIGIIPPTLGSTYFFYASFLIKKINQKKRLEFIKSKYNV